MPEQIKCTCRVEEPDEYVDARDTDAMEHFRVQHCPLHSAAPDMLAALKAVVSTYRTFRDVPKDEQEWTPLDDEALDAAFAAIERAER